jgi:hypothetical protein
MIHRRDAMLRLGQLGLGALTLPQLIAAQPSLASSSSPPKAKARSCILIYLWGGPPQQDMWDMKPDAPSGIRSEFQPIDTATPGLQISDQLPRIARQSDKLAIIRSMSHASNMHEVGVYHTLTGKVNPTLVVPRNMRARHDFPNVGAIVSNFTPPGGMPATVTVPRPIGHDGVIYTGTYAGFLGPRHDPIELQLPGEVQGKPPFSFELLEGLDYSRVASRFGLLKMIEQQDRALQIDGAASGHDASRQQAFRMLASPEARGAFNLDTEDPRTRDRYGRNEFGDSFLLARRLVEGGVRLVTVVWYYICPDGNVINVWDNHGGTASLGGVTGYQMLKEKYCLPPLDLAYSALVEDLSERGLLDETLVAMYGEFGRTPKINKTAGRDHWGPCQSVVMAGGGVRGGQIYGSSDDQAAYPKTNPVAPEDILATIYHALGISTDAEIHDPAGRPYRITDGRPIVELFG